MLHVDLHGPLDLMHVVGDDQQFVVLVFYDRFHELFHSSRVSGRITTTIRPDTCLTILTKKLSISHIMAVFMSYCPQFWGSRVIYNDPKTRYMFVSYDPKLVVFHVLWTFS